MSPKKRVPESTFIDKFKPGLYTKIAVVIVLFLMLVGYYLLVPPSPDIVKEALSEADTLHFETLYPWLSLEEQDVSAVYVTQFLLTDQSDIERFVKTLVFEGAPEYLNVSFSTQRVIIITISHHNRENKMTYFPDGSELVYGKTGRRCIVKINKEFHAAIIEHAKAASLNQEK